jgi:hypothetical protein
MPALMRLMTDRKGITATPESQTLEVRSLQLIFVKSQQKTVLDAETGLRMVRLLNSLEPRSFNSGAVPDALEEHFCGSFTARD